MQKIIVLILASIFSIQMEAQEKPKDNKWTLGGSISFSRDESASSVRNLDFVPNTNNFSYYEVDNIVLFGSINPYVTKRLTKNSILGFGLVAESQSIKRLIDIIDLMEEQKTTTNTLGINLFYRHNIFAKQRFEIFLQTKAEYLYSVLKSEVNSEKNDESKSREYSAHLDPGLNYSLSEKWNIIIIVNGLSYRNYKFNSTNDNLSDINNSFGVNTSLKNIRLGIEFKF